MHDKPTDETKLAPDSSTESPGGAVDPAVGMARLPDRVAELSAVDPADAPDVADEIAAVLETSLESASGWPADDAGRGPGSVAGDR